MPFNSVGQYTGTHKPYDHVGNIVPDIEHSEGIRPAYEFQPARWLPVQFYDKHYENWNVIMPGKIVGLDQDGYVIPAEYCAGIATSTTVTYTADDVSAGTINITDGEAVATADIGSYTLTDIDGSTYSFMGQDGIAWGPASYPIGVAPYSYLQHPGGDASNPANYTYNNYNMQHQVAVLCDYVLKLPLVPAQAATETLNSIWTSSAMTFGTNAGWRTNTYIRATARYDASSGLYPCLTTYDVAAYALDNYPVATDTARTTFVGSPTTVLVNEVGSMSAITAAGDYWVDYDVGVLFVFSAADGTTLPSLTSLTYYHYAGAVTTLSRFGCVLSTTTELIPGDFLVPTTQSNWVRVATPGPTNTTANFANVMGQVIAIYSEPRDYLDYVRTAYTSINTSAAGAMSDATAGSASVGLGQMDQMAGTATGGVSNLVHYAGAADQVVLINLINR